jgi:hypothetical protein
MIWCKFNFPFFYSFHKPRPIGHLQHGSLLLGIIREMSSKQLPPTTLIWVPSHRERSKPQPTWTERWLEHTRGGYHSRLHPPDGTKRTSHLPMLISWRACGLNARKYLAQVRRGHFLPWLGRETRSLANPWVGPSTWIPSPGPSVPLLVKEVEEPITSSTGWHMHST